MRTSEWVRAATVLALLATAGWAYADPDAVYLDHEEAQQLYANGVIVGLEAIIAEARSRQPGRLLEAKLERKKSGYIYEVEILDPDGHVWELKFSAHNGLFLKREEDN